MSISTPETDGPIAAAKLTMRPMMPMALPRFSRGNTKSMSANTVGMSTPVAAAWTRRPTIKNGKLGAAAQRADPATNSAMPPTNSRCVGNLPRRYVITSCERFALRAGGAHLAATSRTGQIAWERVATWCLRSEGREMAATRAESHGLGPPRSFKYRVRALVLLAAVAAVLMLRCCFSRRAGVQAGPVPVRTSESRARFQPPLASCGASECPAAASRSLP